jgi:hypothetical protein
MIYLTTSNYCPPILRRLQRVDPAVQSANYSCRSLAKQSDLQMTKLPKFQLQATLLNLRVGSEIRNPYHEKVELLLRSKAFSVEHEKVQRSSEASAMWYRRSGCPLGAFDDEDGGQCRQHQGCLEARSLLLHRPP